MTSSAAPRTEDHLALLDLWGRYCATLDRKDLDAHVQVFAQDATYHVYGREVSGRDGIRKMLDGAPHGLHLGGPPVVEWVDASTAQTTHNLYFVPVEGEPRRAVYTGTMRKTSEGWRIGTWRCQFITAEGLKDRP